MNLINKSIARGMYLVSPSGSDLARKAYGVLFTAAGTFTAVSELGDAVSLTVAVNQQIDCVFTRITAAPAGTWAFKVS